MVGSANKCSLLDFLAAPATSTNRRRVADTSKTHPKKTYYEHREHNQRTRFRARPRTTADSYAPSSAQSFPMKVTLWFDENLGDDFYEDLYQYRYTRKLADILYYFVVVTNRDGSMGAVMLDDPEKVVHPVQYLESCDGPRTASFMAECRTSKKKDFLRYFVEKKWRAGRYPDSEDQDAHVWRGISAIEWTEVHDWNFNYGAQFYEVPGIQLDDLDSEQDSHASEEYSYDSYQDSLHGE